MGVKQTEALKLALEGAANYIDALGGDSRKYRQALAEQPAQQYSDTSDHRLMENAHGDLERITLVQTNVGIGKPAQQQEPVAWVDLIKEADEIVRGKVLWKRFIDGTPLANDIAVWMADFAQKHTSPPASKPWVGLTEEEVDDLSREMVKGNKSVNWLARAIEAKIKEKNNG